MFYCVKLLSLIEYKKVANESSELHFHFKIDIIFNTTSERSNKPIGSRYESPELQQQRKNNNRRVYLDILLVRVKICYYLSDSENRVLHSPLENIGVRRICIMKALICNVRSFPLLFQ